MSTARSVHDPDQKTFPESFTLGFGLDAHVYSGWMLDSGGGRAGKARLLGVDNEGHPKDQFSRDGALTVSADAILTKAADFN
ncbi:Outer membrane porin, OprD family [Pseudomonas chlororaphis subsp. piscium]|uniref:Outer membrane porin n=1 Tax=Pseudomonas chlororaphis TaxID=587753 RepID=A0AAX3FX40_9PSED|nr:Outer membrane porin, OprD family [Pseudomonas chlororaphis subsp. piscium]VEF75378.1 outer membrane porin [Pseudomonas chlororaphis]AZC47503.1 Outer membrane porin, OprD family [Pseudomonas chlororaphis subsp. piscium]AZC54185.1 Outer membrane porin, OprD family [Pseudomonas chlororaphis subsp. piscium]AZC60512.1 Outer membrane porin, OprD family [Pseudomonas chlororaphis subsp. piscium]